MAAEYDRSQRVDTPRAVPKPDGASLHEENPGIQVSKIYPIDVSPSPHAPSTEVAHPDDSGQSSTNKFSPSRTELIDGDPDAFRKWYDVRGGAWRSMGLRYMGNPHDAEDIVQETLEKVVKHPEKFRGGNVEAWTNKILANTALDGLRSRKTRESRMPVTNDGTLPDPTAETVDREQVEGESQAALAVVYERINNSNMPEEYKETVALRLNGDSYDEIAEQLGIKVGTVRSRLSRGHAYLREHPGEVADSALGVWYKKRYEDRQRGKK